MPKFDKRYWWSPDGTRSIDLAAVVEVEIMRVGCSYRLSGDAAHPLWLDGKAGSDSFLTALRAWRENLEKVDLDSLRELQAKTKPLSLKQRKERKRA